MIYQSLTLNNFGGMMIKHAIRLILLFLTSQLIYSDELYLIDGNHSEGKVNKIVESYVYFVKKGNAYEVKINKMFIDLIIVNDDTIKIEHPKLAVQVPIAKTEEEIKAEEDKKILDSINNYKQDSLQAAAYIRKLVQFDKVSHSAFLSWSATLPFLPLGPMPFGNLTLIITQLRRFSVVPC